MFDTMIIGDNTFVNVHGFTDVEIRRMRDFLLGAVQVWCRDRNGEWFAARDLLGGGNDDYSRRQAGRAAGHLLKRVPHDDPKRTYETRRRFTHEYRWVGEERR